MQNGAISRFGIQVFQPHCEVPLSLLHREFPCSYGARGQTSLGTGVLQPSGEQKNHVYTVGEGVKAKKSPACLYIHLLFTTRVDQTMRQINKQKRKEKLN